MDHARDGITPLTAYEFRCPFGLVFDEGKLACDWPWLVGGCGNRGISGVLIAKTAGATANIHTATFINGGNLAASYGQYGQDAYLTSYGGSYENSIHEASGFGIKSQAGASYIASSYDDNQNKASFATVPEYEISGGRILNHGGVVLNQHLNLVGVSGHSGSGYNEINQYSNIESQKIRTHEQSQVLPLVETIAEKAVLTKLEPTLYQYPLSTPRPFSVDVPSVQVNEEKESGYSSQTIISSTPQTFVSSTPQTFVSSTQETFLSSTPQTIVSSTPATLVTAAKSVSEGYVYEKPSIQLQVPVVTPKPEVLVDVKQTSFEGYSYEKPKIAFELPKVQNELVHSISLKEQSVQLPSPRPFEVEQPIVQYQPIAIKARPVVYSTPAPAFYKQTVSVTPQKYVTPVRVSSPRPFSVVESVSISTPRPVLYEQKQEILQPVISTPRPFTIQQPVVYEQKHEIVQPVISTPRPFTVQQEVVQPVSISTPRPIVYEHRQQLVTPKPVIYEQKQYLPPVQQYVTPKSIVYEQKQYLPPVQGVTNKIIYETPKVAISTARPFVYEQKQIIAPRPVVYEQRQQYVTPKPVVYEQQVQISTPKPIIAQPVQVSTPRPIVYEQRVNIETPKPVVYEQVRPVQISTPRPVVYTQQKIIQPVQVQQEYVSIKQPIQISTPKPIVYEQVQPIQVSTPRPVVYTQSVKLETPKPVVYEQREYLPPPKIVQQPVQVQQEYVQVSTPRPVVYQQPKVVQPVQIQQEYVQVSTPKQVVYTQETPKPVYAPPVQQYVHVSTPKPVVYTSPKIVQPIHVQQEYVQVNTPKPVVYTQETPKPYVYTPPKIVQPVQVQHEFVQVSTPKPVVYQQVSTPKPIVVQPIQVQQEYVQIKQKPIQVVQPTLEYLPPETPKAVLFGLRQKPIRYEEKQYVTTPQPISTREYLPPVQVTTQQPVIYEQKQVLQQIPISTTKPVVYQQEYVQVSTPKPIYRQQYIQPVSRPQEIFYKQQPQSLVVQQPVEISTSKLIYEEEQIVTEKPRPIVVEQRFKQRPVVYQEEFQIQNLSTEREYLPPSTTEAIVRTKSRSRYRAEEFVKKTKESTAYFVENYEKTNPAISVLQQEIVQTPVVETREYLPPISESAAAVDGYFEFQKLSKIKSNVVQENVTASYDYSPPSYGYNSKIEIAPPPQEYLVDVTSTTKLPEYSSRYSAKSRTRVRVKPTTSTTEATVEAYSAPEYLPPSSENYPESYIPPRSNRRRPSGRKSKTTVVSIGEVDKKEIDEENVEILLDKYSGKFGDLLDEDKEKFVTKVIQGDGKGKIKVGKEPEVSTVGYEVTSSRSRQRGRGRKYGSSSSTTTTTEAYEEEESTTENEETADVSLTSLDLKNLKLKKDKKTVIVVSQVSDANPLLIGKLASQCSCQSNNVELKKGSKNYSPDEYSTTESQRRGRTRRPKVSDNIAIDAVSPNVDYRSNFDDTSDPTILIGGPRTRRPGSRYRTTDEPSSTYRTSDEPSGSYYVSDEPSGRYRTSSEPSSRYRTSSEPSSRYRTSNEPSNTYDDNDSSSSLPDFSRKVPSSTTEALFLPEKPNGRRIPSRSRSRNENYDFSPNDISSIPLFSPIPADEIASTVDYASVKARRPENSIDDGLKSRKTVQGSKVAAGAAFDRYGPGGWRGADEMLQGSVDCKRPGLFRHPKYCNKFYSCNYDPWKKRYTLAVFNCPVHLAYDSNLGACNWPSKGPACADDNLLV